jgi:hypothetical protein
MPAIKHLNYGPGLAIQGDATGTAASNPSLPASVLWPNSATLNDPRE